MCQLTYKTKVKFDCPFFTLGCWYFVLVGMTIIICKDSIVPFMFVINIQKITIDTKMMKTLNL